MVESCKRQHVQRCFVQPHIQYNGFTGCRLTSANALTRGSAGIWHNMMSHGVYPHRLNASDVARLQCAPIGQLICRQLLVLSLQESCSMLVHTPSLPMACLHKPMQYVSKQTPAALPAGLPAVSPQCILRCCIQAAVVQSCSSHCTQQLQLWPDRLEGRSIQQHLATCSTLTDHCSTHTKTPRAAQHSTQRSSHT